MSEADHRADVVEETLGFGETEWRTFRDHLVRPRAALDAYLERGPTGGGQYRRPLGFYIALCGVAKAVLLLMVLTAASFVGMVLVVNLSLVGASLAG